MQAITVNMLAITCPLSVSLHLLNRTCLCSAVSEARSAGHPQPLNAKLACLRRMSVCSVWLLRPFSDSYSELLCYSHTLTLIPPPSPTSCRSLGLISHSWLKGFIATLTVRFCASVVRAVVFLRLYMT